MKIQSVGANNHKKAFEVRTRGGAYLMPYAKLSPRPSPRNRVIAAYVDPELGHEGFTYELESGDEGTVHVDSVLEYNEDPSAIADLAMYELTLEAQKRVDQSDLSRRELARRLKTSVPQLYRLLDQTNYRKSMRQLLSLLAVLGWKVELKLRKRPSGGRRLAG